MLTNRPLINIYTDGSYRKTLKRGGWSALLTCGDWHDLIWGYEKNTTNNRMELMAIIAGLSMVRDPSNIMIITDSQYSIRGCSMWLKKWKKGNWLTNEGKPVQNKDLFERIDELMKPHTVTFRWVKAHQKDLRIRDARGNDLVDHFAFTPYEDPTLKIMYDKDRKYKQPVIK